MKKLRNIAVILLLAATVIPSLAITRKQWKLNLREENEELQEELADLEAQYNDLVNQIAALDSVTNEIFDGIESVSTDTVSIASGHVLSLRPVLQQYRDFKPTIELIYPETGKQIAGRVGKLTDVIAAAEAYRNVAGLLNKVHTQKQLSDAVDSLTVAAQSRLLTKNQKKEIEKMVKLAENEWEDHTFLSELLAEVVEQWGVVPDKQTAAAILKDYVWPTMSTAYPGKKQFPAQYGFLNSVLGEFTGALSDFEANSSRLSDERAYQQWMLSLANKMQ